MNVVEQNMNQVSKLLEQHMVDNLYLFGSVLSENFTLTSDIDFLVNFGQVEAVWRQARNIIHTIQ